MKSKDTSTSRRKFLRRVSGATAAALASGVAGVAGAAGEAGIGPLNEPASTAAAPDNHLSTEDQINLSGSARAEKAYELRVQAALYQKIAPLPIQSDNGDENRYPNRIGSFSKGLPHNQLGEVDQPAYNTLLEALRTGNPDDFERIQMGGGALLKNPQAGLTFEMQGSDPGHLFIPPAPAFSSAEIAGEIAENYWMALCRDVFFLDYGTDPLTVAAAKELDRLSDFQGPRFQPRIERVPATGQTEAQNIAVDLDQGRSGAEQPDPVRRVRDDSSIGPVPIRKRFHGTVEPSTLFRGSVPGATVGPYLSQFLWKDIPYGVQTISQKMRTTIAGDDYLTGYHDWLFAQNSRGNVNLPNRYDQTPRYIRNGRDLGEWVHIDVLFQAYFNATLILLGMNAPVDQNNPYQNSRTQCGFGTFGPPHIQSMVCAVATNALRAVWYQKWYVHRRLRPEEFAGRIHNHLTKAASYPIHSDILNSTVVEELNRRNGSYLLPMAFQEGCPTHPAYGAGHATVAGACVTVLKAWFDESWVIPNPVVPSSDGLSLTPYQGPDLTVGGELNKLASNVAIGRNFAGVHWRSDATQSLKFGESVAISVLTDLKSCYNERFEGFTLTKFDGSKVTI